MKRFECGRTASCDMDFIIDNQGPTIACPGSVTFECPTDFSAKVDSVLQDFQAGNNITVSCDYDYTVTHNYSAPTDSCPSTTTVTFTVEDECGRTASCDMDFIIDNQRPTIACPGSVTFECPTDFSAKVDSVLQDFQAGNNITVSCDYDYTVTHNYSAPTDSCPSTTTVTFTVEDECGPTASCDMDFIIDNQGPTIACPGSVTFECPTDFSAKVDSVLQDFQAGNNITVSCDYDYTVTHNYSAPTDSCPSTTTVTFTVEDECGPTASCDMDFIIDNQGPTIACPGSVTFECPTDFSAKVDSVLQDFQAGNNITVSCDYDYTVTHNYSAPTDSCPSTTTVTFTVEDECGRTASCDMDFIIDNQRPTIACPGSVTFECPTDFSAKVDSVLQDFQAGNNITVSCDYDYTVTHNYSAPTDSCPSTTTVTFTVEDECGRTASCDMDFIIDNQGPTIACPGSVTFECPTDFSAKVDSVLQDFQAGNNITVSCDYDYTVTHNYSAPTDSCPSTTTVTFTVEDECGRTASCDMDFIIDNQGPTIACPGSITFECPTDFSAKVDSVLQDFQAGNNITVSCDYDYTVTHNYSAPTDSCPSTTTVTFTVEDECGPTASCDMDFIIDNQGPTIACPGSVTFECPTDFSAKVDSVLQDFQAGNNITVSCDYDYTVTHNYSAPTDSCPSTTTVTFTVEDECGRTASCDMDFIIDNQRPTIACPGSVTFECPTDFSAKVDSVLQDFQAGNNITVSCDYDYTVTHNYSAPTDSCPSTTTVTFTVEDECGRTASCDMDFIIDNQGPTIACPGSVTFECPTDFSAKVDSVLQDFQAGNNITVSCDYDYTVTHNYSAPTDSCPSTTTVTFTVEDECGRTASCDMDFIIDNQRPTIACPGSVTFECPTDFSAKVDSVLQDFQAGNNITVSCDYDYTVTHNYSAPTDSCPSTTTVTFTVEDECGRTASCDMDFIIDNQGPTIACPGSVTFECPTDFSAKVDSVLQDFQAGNNITVSCDYDYTVTHNYSAPTDSCPSTTTVTFTVEDECGRTASCDMDFIIDNQGPTIACPGSVTFECPTDFSAKVDSVLQDFQAGNNITVSCDYDYTVTHNYSAPTDSCPSTTTVTFTVEDECGRTASCDMDFIIDNQGPTIACPGSVTFECPTDFSAKVDSVLQDFQAGNNITVSCDYDYTVTHNYSAPTDSCPSTTTVTFTVEDECGRTASCDMDFIIDNQGPTIACPGSVTFECPTDFSAKVDSVLQDFQAGNNITVSCDYDYTVTHNYSAPTDSCPSTTTVTFTVEDECGRTASCDMDFIIDNQGPTIACPGSVTFECPTDFSAKVDSVLQDFQAGNNITVSCDYDYTVTHNYSAPTDSCPSTTTVTFTVEDECGRTASCDMDFIIDNQGPTIACPGSVTFECPTDFSAKVDSVLQDFQAGNNITVSCDYDYTVTHNYSAPTDSCPSTTTVTFTVEDECGRTASCDMDFIIDNQGPTIACPGSVTFECPTDFSAKVDSVLQDFQAGNNITVSCDYDYTVTHNFSAPTDSCPSTTTVTFTVEDECGRTASCDMD